MRLIQFLASDGTRRLAAAEHGLVHELADSRTVLDLARTVLLQGASQSLADAARAQLGEPISLAQIARGQLLPAVDHPDAARCVVSGTGLTHLGSAQGRDLMHRNAQTEHQTDSMRMFLMGAEGGKPAPGETGAQPEWFYKGDGSIIVGPNDPLPSPDFALDGSEEPEIAGIYLIDENGSPRRLGFALANEFSDHVTERGNYLWLAHSKLRHAALGAELLLGDLPAHISGTSRVLRDGETLWEREFLTGEDNMSHTIANLEAHHFKYDLFRRPGDLHIHFFGTATLSFAEGVTIRDGDIFEISAPPFELPLRNPRTTLEARPVEVTAL